MTPTRSIVARCTAHATLASPLGQVLIARTDSGLAGLWFEAQKWHPGPMDAPERADDPLLREAARQLSGYFAGQCMRFDLPLDLHGTEFQRSVWRALCRIESGSTRSYGDIANSLGLPRAVRAVGAAVGRNPLSLVVPCHRVLGAGGQLTGYAGGLERKRALLALEGAPR